MEYTDFGLLICKGFQAGIIILHFKYAGKIHGKYEAGCIDIEVFLQKCIVLHRSYPWNHIIFRHINELY